MEPLLPQNDASGCEPWKLKPLFGSTLSRACPGKSIAFCVNKRLQQRTFSHPLPPGPIDGRVRRSTRENELVDRAGDLRKTIVLLSFPYVCPESVLAKRSFLASKEDNEDRSRIRTIVEIHRSVCSAFGAMCGLIFSSSVYEPSCAQPSPAQPSPAQPSPVRLVSRIHFIVIDTTNKQQPSQSGSSS